MFVLQRFIIKERIIYFVFSLIVYYQRDNYENLKYEPSALFSFGFQTKLNKEDNKQVKQTIVSETRARKMRESTGHLIIPFVLKAVKPEQMALKNKTQYTSFPRIVSFISVPLINTKIA